MALSLGACGGDKRRTSVADYIDRANAVQAQAGPALARANRAYAAFSQRRITPTQAPVRLAASERTIRATRARLARLTAPPDARSLHRSLLQLYDLGAGLAGETTTLARYLPAAQRALRPLPGINARLRGELRGSRTPAEQARALARFARDLGPLADSLRRLAAPPLLGPTHRAQLAKLVRTQKLARQLREAVAARASKRVATILRRFRKLNQGTGAGGATLQADALAAYQRRYRGLQRAAAAVQRERDRLERELG